MKRGPLVFHNPLDGLRYATIQDTDRNQTLDILYPIPLPKNKWGVLLPLLNTSWGKEIPTVSGEALSHAFHGHTKPLREMLGTPPRIRAQRVPEEDRFCLEGQRKLCPMVTPLCTPGSGKLPECYVPPTEDRVLRQLGHAVASAWDEGRYVFFVSGPEFVIT